MLWNSGELPLNIMTRVLKRIGYDVLTASGGREAIEMVRQKRAGISLVILDMIMPGMNGSQTYDALRGVVPDIKVLVSSGYSTENVRHRELRPLSFQLPARSSDNASDDGENQRCCSTAH